MNPHRLTYGFAFDFQFAAIVAVTTLIGLLVARESKRIPMTGTTVALLIFTIWMNITTLFALVPADAFTQWEKVMKVLLMTFVTLMLIKTRQRLEMLIWVIVVSIGFYGIKGGFFTIISGGEQRVWGPWGSFIWDNNELALALIMILPLMRYLQLNAQQWWVRHGLTAAMVLSVASIFGSHSRGALLAGAAMALFLLLKTRKKFPILIVMALVIPVMINFMPDKWTTRMETIKTYKQDTSAMGRINAWWFAYNLAKERPVVGGGYEAFNREIFRNYAPEPDDFHDAHSIYFEILAEHGFVGLALFLALGLLAIKTGTWIIRHTKQQEDLKWACDLAKMTQVGLVGYAVGGAFLGRAYFDLYYHLIAILVIAQLIVKQVLESREETMVEKSIVEDESANFVGSGGTN